MFYAVYYISMISEIKKIECELNESGIFGGRGMGILINMFSLQYIFELYKKPLVCIVLIVVSVIVLILSRKYIKSSKNEILNSTTTFGGGIYSRTVKVYSFI